MAGKKISAVITVPGHEPYRAYFQESHSSDGTPLVIVWTAGNPWIGFKSERFNGGEFSRQWVRELFADHNTRTTVEF